MDNSRPTTFSDLLELHKDNAMMMAFLNGLPKDIRRKAEKNMREDWERDNKITA